MHKVGGTNIIINKEKEIFNYYFEHFLLFVLFLQLAECLPLFIK